VEIKLKKIHAKKIEKYTKNARITNFTGSNQKPIFSPHLLHSAIIRVKDIII